mgnify:FL=1
MKTPSQTLTVINHRTITQRFVMPSTVEGQTAEVDIDADCRLVFFVEKKADGWKTHFFKGQSAT